MSFVKRLSVVLSLIVCLSLIQSAWSAPAFSQAVTQAGADAPAPAGENVEPVANRPYAPAQPVKTLSDALRVGKYPAQLAGATGAMRPDQHGPQRTDPAEGIPTHAYSPFDERRTREYPCPPGGCAFVPGKLLVKLAPQVTGPKQGAQAGPAALTADAAANAALAAQGITALEPLFPNARPPAAGALAVTPDGATLPMPDLTRWYRATLHDVSADLTAAADALSAAPGIAWAEPDYLRKPVGEFGNGETWGNSMELGGTQGNSPNPLNSLNSLSSRSSLAFTDPLYPQQWHLAATNVPQAWQWLSDHGLPPGGNRDIVVAVIDTGVDLNHPDLSANLWTNSREIAGNGADDDGNGYVDDVHGADMITNSGSPLDDHGHGTHVAGIIAAQAGNGIGGVGVAYNTQIMAIKAAQYSGVLVASDIAEGIYYAAAQGADVINMSFGGYSRSQVEEDALAVAFGQAVLVAAAGNDGKVNLPCPFGRDMYPAAYNWVLGVMARQPNPDAQGDYLAGFSNYDCKLQDSHEYELMAPGVDVWSTLPNNQYAAWDGTSMAAPVVSGIAALARTKWADKDVYSSRFIMGQIATTGGLMQAYTPQQGPAVSYYVPNAYAALTTFPKPKLSYLEHWTFDTAAQAAGNDDDGIVDAGETIDLAVVIRNQWGKADPVTVTLEAWAAGAFQPDPYVTMITGTVDYGAVGSFNWDDNGLIYDAQGVITGVRNPFRFRVDPNTPNDHMIPFRLTMVAGNGYDPAAAPLTFVSRFYLIVQRGRELPRIISQDMTLTKDDYWLIPDATLIEAGVHVTVTEGTQIQFWSADPNDPYNQRPKPFWQVEGTLLVHGSQGELVEMFPGTLYEGYPVEIRQIAGGHVELRYVSISNPAVGITYDSYVGSSILGAASVKIVDHSRFSQKLADCIYWPEYDYNNIACDGPTVRADIIRSSIFRQLAGKIQATNFWWAFKLSDPSYGNLYDSSCVVIEVSGGQDNVFLKNLNSLHWVSQAHNTGFACNGCDFTLGRTSNEFRNNAILNMWWDTNTDKWLRFYTSSGRYWSQYITDNYWGTTSTRLIDAAIQDYNDDFNLGLYVYQPLLAVPATTTYPFAVNVVLSTASDADANVVGAELVTFTVTFNRNMDTSIQPMVSFGPDVPMTDYTIHPINGGWTNARTWQGAFNITPVTGDGYQLIRVAGARAADDPWLVTGDDAGRFRFEIITSGTESMNLQATGGEGRVSLTWTQNDFDLLAGFNLYRATAQDGAYSRINTSIIPPATRAFTDTAVTPGQPYYYKFTVVKSDMAESDYSNVAQGTPLDTIPPVLAHTPVTEAPPGLPLTLYADVTDNVVVQDVILHYKAITATTYLSRTMVRTTGNRYAATIEGGRVAYPGMAYYIEATDGISTVRNGRPEYPNLVGVVDRPVVTSLSPNRGPAAGGATVTISGSNFKAGAKVTFDGAAAPKSVVVSSTQMTCTTPAHFPAAADVTVTNPDTQRGTLLRGYTFESSVAALSLPHSGGGQHDIVQIPVNADNVAGLAAADLTVTFDPAALSPRGARTGTLTPGWSLATNTGTAGQARLSLASAGGASSGTGSLALLEFEVTGAPGVTTTLRIAAAALNDGAIPIQKTDGSFTVGQVYRVAGATRFWNGSAGVPAVAFTLDGDRVYTAIGDPTGVYTVTGARAGSYTLRPGKSDGANGITAYDASLALQHAAGLAALSGYGTTAGDVNRNGAISSMDAFYILQGAVDLILLPFPGAGIVWTFDPTSRSYPVLNSNQAGQDFTAVLLGDISGNWSAAPALAAAGAPAAGPAITLTVRTRPADPAGQTVVELAVDAGDVPLFSLDLALTYTCEAAPCTPAAVTAVQPGPLADGLAHAVNLTEPGLARIALAGALPITGRGVLLTIHLQDARPGSLMRSDANEGRVPVQVVYRPGGFQHFLPLIVKGDGRP